MAYRQEVFAAAAALAEDHHVVRVAAEALDVLVHPLERVTDIQQALVARGGVLLAAQVAQVQVAHEAQAVVAGHHDDIQRARQVGAILIGRPPEPVVNPPPWL